MTKPILFLTGFEPFLDTVVNSSGELARALHGSEVSGVEIHATVLPVSFQRMPVAYGEALGALPAERVIALLSLGVQRESYFRLETRARPVLDSAKPDVDGAYVRDLKALGKAERTSSLDLESLAQSMRDVDARDVRLSSDAGGYVCERCYWELLGIAGERGLSGCFLHVPPIDAYTVEQQLVPVRAFIDELISQAKSA